MDSDRLKGAGRLIEIKQKKKTSYRDFDYWPPNRGGCLIGGRLIGGSTILWSLLKLFVFYFFFNSYCMRPFWQTKYKNLLDSSDDCLH